MPPKKIVVHKMHFDEEQISVKTNNTAGNVKASVAISINYLNFDCLENIVKYLPIKDRVAAERVSKQWNTVCKSSWGSFEALNFKKNLWGIEKKFHTRSKEDRLKMFESVLSRCGKFLKSLDMSGFTCDGQDENLNDFILNTVKKNCTKLKSFYNITNRNIMGNEDSPIDKSLIPILKEIIKNLQNLDCVIDYNVTDEDLKLLFTSSKELENLKMTVTGQITGEFLYFLNHKKIKVLHLSICNQALGRNPMYYAIQKCENLESLHLGRCYTNGPTDYLFDESNFESKFEWPNTLKSLCLEYIDNISLISEMTSLTTLELHDTFISDTLLFQIAKNCFNLQVLALRPNPTENVTDEGVQALSILSKLEDLTLNCLEITGRSLKHFSKLKKFGGIPSENVDGKSFCKVLLTCRELEQLSINFDVHGSDAEYEESIIKFFTSAENFLKQRHFITKNPLKIILYSSYVVVTSNRLLDLKEVKLFYELYEKHNCVDDNKSKLIFGTDDLLQLINELKVIEDIVVC